MTADVGYTTQVNVLHSESYETWRDVLPARPAPGDTAEVTLRVTVVSVTSTLRGVERVEVKLEDVR